MNKLIKILALLAFTVTASAQVPYFGTSNGKGKTYTYFSTKFHPGENNQQMYMTAQYGVMDKLDIATDATVGSGWAYQGFGIRFNIVDYKYFTLGGQAMTSFDLCNNYKFDYEALSLYLNGKIWKGLSWDDNLWYTVYDKSSNTVDNWFYLIYDTKYMSPAVGWISNWTKDKVTSDLALGVYFPIGKHVYGYVWGSGLLGEVYDQRVVLGFDYKF